MRHVPSVSALMALIPPLLGCRPGQTPETAGERAPPAALLDRADQLLLAAAKVALPPLGVAAGDLPEPASRGAQLVVQYCAQCHALPTPTAHSGTD